MSGWQYQLQYKDSLDNPEWQNLGVALTAIGSSLQYEETIATKAPIHLFRVQLLIP